MIDPKFIRDNPEKVKLNAQERFGASGVDIVDQWLKVDVLRNEGIRQQEEMLRERNELAELGRKESNNVDFREKGKVVKEMLRGMEDKLTKLNAKWNDLLMQIPNMHFDDVPRGTSDKENVVLRKVGTPPTFDFTPKDHVELGRELDIIDFETGAKVAGSQFYYLKNDAVQLEFALIQFGLEFFRAKGFDLVITPDLAKSRFYLGTGYAPRGDEAQTYEIKDEDLGLIATAEVTMAGMKADEILNEEVLPQKYAAISHCYRKEAGAYGKYSRGLYRVHQFSKLEMFVYCTPEQSQELHQELLAIEEEIAQALEIPYQVVEMCTGDLGAMAARKYDLEAWLPGRGDYGEITSTSNCTDYQARNLNIKYRDQTGKTHFVHMLNGTAIVMSRFPIAVLENYQQADGSIRIPKVLQKYFGKEYIGRQ